MGSNGGADTPGTAAATATAAPYDSGVFPTGITSRIHGSSVFVDDQGTLWMVGPGEDGQLYATTVPLVVNGTTISIEEGALEKATWSSTQIKFAESNPKLFDWRPWAFSTCSLVALDGMLNLFWNQQSVPLNPNTDSGVYNDGTLVASLNDGSGWQHPVQLVGSDGTPVITSGRVVFVMDEDPGAATCADVSVTTFGTGTAIVACALALPQSTGTPDWDSGNRGIYLGIYNPIDRDVSIGTWKAAWHTYITWNELQASNAITGLGYQISVDWFPTPSADADGPTYMVTLCSNPQVAHDSTPTPWYLQGRLVFDGQGMPAEIAFATPGPRQPPAAWQFARVPPASFGSMQPCSIKRDPAGRLVAVGTAPKQQIAFVSYPAVTDVPSGHYLLPGTAVAVQAPSADDVVPQVAYFTDPTSLPLPEPHEQSDPIAIHPVYLLCFWSADPRCEVRRYGTIEVLESTGNTPYPTGEETVNVVQGIIDGPIPVPNENIAHGNGKTECGEIAYGNVVTGGQSVRVASEQTVGFTFEEKFTKGVGPAFQGGFEAGAGSAAGSSTQWGISQNKPLAADVEKGEDGSKVIFPRGIMFCETPTLNVMAYRFRGPDGTLWSDPSSNQSTIAAGSVQVQVDLETNGGITHVPYCPFAVAPGNILSYTPQAWNARMQDLESRFNHDPALYAGPHYFGDVIVANAYHFGGGVEYLQASWSSGSANEVKSTATTETFTERTWTMSSDFYAGISGGAGFQLFGLGEVFEFSALAGTTCSDTGNSDSSSGAEWGIELPAEWGPTSSDASDPLQYLNYSFRIYLLPVASTGPANVWTRELIQFLGRGAGDSLEVELTHLDEVVLTTTITYPTPQELQPDPQSIDPGAATWRIVFVLESFTRNDNLSWTYDGRLG
ncbi:MAG TPA: hypothetical protein VF101_11325 [Gaiellaceae bacterium]